MYMSAKLLALVHERESSLLTKLVDMVVINQRTNKD